MGRATLTVTAAAGRYPSASVPVTMTAADASSQNQCQCTGHEIVVFNNTGSSTRAVTVTAAADPYGRSTDAAYSLAAGAIATCGPFPVLAWKQADGYMYLEAAHADVEIGVIVLPGPA